MDEPVNRKYHHIISISLQSASEAEQSHFYNHKDKIALVLTLLAGCIDAPYGWPFKGTRMLANLLPNLA